MEALFTVLFVLCCVGLIVGLAKPRLVIYWGKKRGRLSVLILYVPAILVSIILMGVAAPASLKAEVAVQQAAAQKAAEQKVAAQQAAAQQATAQQAASQKAASQKAASQKAASQTAASQKTTSTGNAAGSGTTAPPDTGQSPVVPTVVISPSQSAYADLSFTGIPSGYKLHEIRIIFFHFPGYSTVAYEDDCFYINGQWKTVSGITPISVNSDGSFSLDFPNGYVGSDAQVAVTFVTPSGQWVNAQSHIFKSDTLQIVK